MKKVVVCKKSIANFVKDIKYKAYEDKNQDSLLISSSPDYQPDSQDRISEKLIRFYYEGYARYTALRYNHILIYEDYFYPIKELRKQKLYNINEKGIV